jgi:hypothetical protein
MSRQRNLAVLDDVKIHGRVTTNAGLRQAVEVPPSPEGGLVAFGGKCEHGVYIPATHLSTNQAPYCSLCHLYRVEVSENGIYKG